MEPLSRSFASDRGTAIDRYYIEQFLSRFSADVRGRVLEIADDRYTQQFGRGRVTRGDVLHVEPGDERATIVADLTSGAEIPAETFDCVICTQTLLCIYDLRAAIRTLHRILGSGGVLLATFPGISQISRYDMDRWGDYWRLTSLSARRLFEEAFASDQIVVETYGNVLTAVAVLHGLAKEELRSEELGVVDPDYEVLIGVRAQRT